jgi:hypothetical protein
MAKSNSRIRQGANRDSSTRLKVKESKVAKSQINTEPQLCQKRFYEECPSSAITDTVFTAGVTGFNFWEVNESDLNGSKQFSSGRVELKIRDRFDLEDFAEIAYQAKEVIAGQFGEKTLKMHYALAAIAFRQPDARQEKIKVSGSRLLADFGEDNKNKFYISKQQQNEDGNLTRYLSKEEKLKEIAHHAYLLKRLEVCVSEWKVPSKRIFSVKLSNLWDITEIEKTTQKNFDGTETVTDVIITYQPGAWYEKFASGEYLREFGYITSEALKLDPYREKMALRIAYFALFGLQQHKSGRYQVETLLKRIGYEDEIETARDNRVIASNLKRSFDRGLKVLNSFQYPYRFDYDTDTPEWVLPNSKQRKPRGWFEFWLSCKGNLKQPELLPKRTLNSDPKTKLLTSLAAEIQSESNISVASARDSCIEIEQLQADKKIDFSGQISGKEFRTVRLAKGDSLRIAAKQLGISVGLLSQIENDRYYHVMQDSLKSKLVNYLFS